jgi:hypothetical protein
MGLKKSVAGLIVALSAVFGASAMAQDAAAPLPAPGTIQAAPGSVKYTNSIYLAYVPSGSAITDNTSKKGLEALAAELAGRTNIEPKGVVALDLERDDLGVFPFIYWPVEPGAATLSLAAQKKVQGYIDRGGIILFDLQNQGVSVDANSALRHMLGSVSFKPLARMGDKHTLTRSFYLTQGLPGAINDGNVLIERDATNGRESISSVIIGDNNWAGAWSGISVNSLSTDRQLALRSGVNMVMYALMGNYKSDQLQLDQILRRLGQ